MKFDKKLVIFVVAIAGWVISAILAMTVFELKKESANAVIAGHEAAEWRRKAGKAYTKLLIARSGGDTTNIMIPAGTLIECSIGTSVADGKTVSLCEDGIVYPPIGY